MIADNKAPPVRVRAGGVVLSLIAGPLTVPILRAHRDQPLRLPELGERIGGAAQATLRGQIGNLRGIGALERRVRSGMPYTVENELTKVGRGILDVADYVESWLSRAPQGAIALGSEPAKGALRALVDGWGSTMLYALAARPLSLTELSNLIGDLSYPALERRLSAMRATSLVGLWPKGARDAKPYAVTEWTRRAMGPLLAAGRCESLYLAKKGQPLTRTDIEVALVLAIPLAEVDTSHSGSCVLAVDTGARTEDPAEGQIADVRVEVAKGIVVSCVSQLEPDPGTWALGAVDSWAEAIVEGRADQIHVGGENPGLANALVVGLHTALFGAAR